MKISISEPSKPRATQHVSPQFILSKERLKDTFHQAGRERTAAKPTIIVEEIGKSKIP